MHTFVLVKIIDHEPPAAPINWAEIIDLGSRAFLTEAKLGRRIDIEVYPAPTQSGTGLFSCTFNLGDDSFSVPFKTEQSAHHFADTLVAFWSQATNIVVNDLTA